MLIFILFHLIFTLSAAIEVEEGLELQKKDLDNLSKRVQETRLFFEEFFNIETAPVDIKIQKSCFRVGYKLEEKHITFCHKENYVNYGIMSKDVISHEVFHALICQQYPKFCTPNILEDEDALAFHEAIADTFTSYMDDNTTFGEDFYKGLPYIRDYTSSYYYSLSDSPYLKAGALSNLFIENFSSDILDQILSTDFSLVTLKKLYPNKLESFWKASVNFDFIPSQNSSRRVWLNLESFDRLEVFFSPNEFLDSALFETRITHSKRDQVINLKRLDKNHFKVTPLKKGIGQYTFHYYLGSQKVGQRSFWFGVR